MKHPYESEAAHAAIHQIGLTLGLRAGVDSRRSSTAANDSHPLASAAAVLSFWRNAGPELWFAQRPEFDREFREGFLHLHEAAARGQLGYWLETAASALALVLLLDQFPRNAFRHTPRMYATDEAARASAAVAIAAGFDRALPAELQVFFYLPFAHSEELDDQHQSVQLCRRLGGISLEHAERHRDIIRRFGRFPHRNPILGRAMTAAEQAYLDDGGFRG